MRMPALLLVAALAVAAPLRAAEPPAVPMRVGTHPEYGRVVFDWPRRVGYEVQEEAGRLVIRFAESARIDLAAARRPPRNVLSIEQDGEAVAMRIAPGARPRHFRIGNRVVIDLRDPVAPPRAAEAAPTREPSERAARPAAAAEPPVPVAATPRPSEPTARQAQPVAAPRPAGIPRHPVAAPVPAPQIQPIVGSTPAEAPRYPDPLTASIPVAVPAQSPAMPAPGAASPHPVAVPGPAAPQEQPAASPRPTEAPHRPGAVTTPVPAAAPTPPVATPTSIEAPHRSNPAAPLTPAALSPRDIAAGLPAADAMRLRLLPGRPAIAFDAGPDAALAVFRRGDRIHLVVDRAVTPDLSALRGHPVFGGLEAQTAGEATLFSLPLPAPARLAARRDGDAWVIEATRLAAPTDAPVLRAAPEAGPPPRLLLSGGRPGQTVALADPATGETLLVGTLREPGPAVLVARRLPEFDLLPTMLGAAIVARSDRLRLRALTADRLVLEAATGASLGLGQFSAQDPPAAAIAMSRLLDLPAGSVPALLERLRTVLSSVGAAPPLARGPGRRDAAETLLALGMPQEAQAMAAIAFQEDPQSREDPRLLLAHGAAALLSGRIGDARGLDDPRLPERDEVALWRALLALARGEAAAAALRGSAPMLLAYPDALRARILPMATEALADGGETIAATTLLAAAGDAPGLGIARAMLAEAEGRPEDAIAMLDQLATGRDRRLRALAIRRLAELRLAAGTIDGAAAAEALEQSLYAWRGGEEEVALRRRIVELRLAAGQGQSAFALLDETGRLYPQHAAALRPAVQDAFALALETAPPLAAATLFDAHSDLLPAGARGEAAVRLLAERLAGLDLPDRAAALLRRAMEASEDRRTRSAIGARLAAMHAADGDAAGTIAALDASESAEIDAPLAARRAILRARAMARSGARVEAEAMLAGLGPAGAAARAELRADAQDWPGAAVAMGEHLASTLPPPPEPLAPAHRAALARHAAYLALAGDEAGLAALRTAQGARMEGGALAEAFGLLTADPVRGVADLPRLQRDLGMARLLPERLEALRAGTQVAR